MLHMWHIYVFSDIISPILIEFYVFQGIFGKVGFIESPGFLGAKFSLTSLRFVCRGKTFQISQSTLCVYQNTNVHKCAKI